jgi:cytochrome c5
MKSYRLSVPFLLLTIGIILVGCGKKAPVPGNVVDEAMRAGRTAESFPAADENYFRDMDGGVELTANEVKGRNNWIVWTGGNDRFWDHLVNKSFGAVDFLKILSSHPGVKHLSRDTRWKSLGLVNEPCFEKAKGPRADRFGLWLDTRRVDCPPDPFESEQKYPGVKFGARGKNIPVGSYYGYASGIVGLRLFPNPDFDEKAQKRWNAEKFYTDKDYYQDKDLVRPYRVGMSCGFCHVGPSPVKPPEDPENPKWENLNSNPGAQYFWVDRILFWEKDEANFIYQLLHTSLPGTLDTSFISTDYINNPRTMNAVYSVGPRLGPALRWGQEKLAGGGLKNKQFQDFPQTAALSKFYKAPDTVWTPRVLKDGADSVGILGALNRVFINIGLFSEEWLLHFNALVGGKEITPIKIEDAEKNSSYWNATAAQTADVALFFLKTAKPDLLKDAPGGSKYLTQDEGKLNLGKVIFAQYCARCHSSKIPEAPPEVDESNWDRYWAWTKTDDFKRKMTAMVVADDFLTDNYLSTERRIPVTLLQTNACSPLATNALGGNIWDNFSSQTYKDLPSVGKITVHNPIDGSPSEYPMPAGGRGYTRVPSLISLWSTAPFLLNNSVGKFRWEPSVEARMDSFNDSIEKMLWPEKREKDAILGDKVPGFIYRTTQTSYIRVAQGFLPAGLEKLLDWGPWLSRFFPWLFREGTVQIGPIPKGTPVNLLTNIDLESNKAELLKLLLKLKAGLKRVEGASDSEAAKIFKDDKELVDSLIKLSKCPDYVVNRGHYFGTDRFKEEPALSDDEKWALIEFLKTF